MQLNIKENGICQHFLDNLFLIELSITLIINNIFQYILFIYLCINHSVYKLLDRQTTFILPPILSPNLHCCIETSMIILPFKLTHDSNHTIMGSNHSVLF